MNDKRPQERDSAPIEVAWVPAVRPAPRVFVPAATRTPAIALCGPVTVHFAGTREVCAPSCIVAVMAAVRDALRAHGEAVLVLDTRLFGPAAVADPEPWTELLHSLRGMPLRLYALAERSDLRVALRIAALESQMELRVFRGARPLRSFWAANDATAARCANALFAGDEPAQPPAGADPEPSR